MFYLTIVNNIHVTVTLGWHDSSYVCVFVVVVFVWFVYLIAP